MLSEIYKIYLVLYKICTQVVKKKFGAQGGKLVGGSGGLSLGQVPWNFLIDIKLIPSPIAGEG
jgi:hypothetical protein